MAARPVTCHGICASLPGAEPGWAALCIRPWTPVMFLAARRSTPQHPTINLWFGHVAFFNYIHWFMVILGMVDTGMTTLDGNKLWNQRTRLAPLSWWGYLHGSVSTASEPVTQEGGAIDLPGWRGEGRVEVTEDPGPSVCR
jgi:hypothetical protein